MFDSEYKRNDELRDPRPEATVETTQRITAKGQLLSGRESEVGEHSDTELRQADGGRAIPVHMTGEHDKASLKRNEAEAESETGECSNRTQAIRRGTYVFEMEFVPAQKESGEKESGYGRDAAQRELRDLPGDF